MKKAVLLTVLAATSLWGLAIWIQGHFGEPESTNPADLEGSAESGEERLEFFTSDPSLLEPPGAPVQEQAVDAATGKGLPGAPYLLLLSDGRYAFGYADADGKTRTLYAPPATTHEVFWYDEAWEKRRALGNSG